MSAVSASQVIKVQEETAVEVTKSSDNAVAANVARVLSKVIGLAKTATQMLMTAIYELGTNIISYAGKGIIRLQIVEKNSCRGIRVIAEDGGPGIEDVQQAMVDGFSTQQQFRSLGLGLGGVSRLMDEMSICSQPGRGTRISACKWMN
ncbi:ATP-binding protein [Marinobacterium jannaschii]|uniref:ATP-binding protein n=1 Tax=Marinobacterium jannaschii TaxID=64970 RepID=UPI00055B3F3A|nr:ATP-binding protein [Marinobacterium jannaschii]